MKRKRITGKDSAQTLLLIDGFSLLHRSPEAADLLRSGRSYPARRRLVERLDRIAGVLADQVVIVFDGSGEGGPAEDFLDVGVEVQYSPSGQTADLVIERMVHSSACAERIRVITSDRMERESVDAAGARHTGCGDFLDEVRRAEKRIEAAAHAGRRRAPANRLDSFFSQSSPTNPPGPQSPKDP